MRAISSEDAEPGLERRLLGLSQGDDDQVPRSQAVVLL